MQIYHFLHQDVAKFWHWLLTMNSWLLYFSKIAYKRVMIMLQYVYYSVHLIYIFTCKNNTSLSTVFLMHMTKHCTLSSLWWSIVHISLIFDKSLNPKLGNYFIINFRLFNNPSAQLIVTNYEKHIEVHEKTRQYLHSQCVIVVCLLSVRTQSNE